MDRNTVHVIGAGLAGLSAALDLSARGCRVVVHEAQKVAGGRCRTHHDPRLGREIDNGNHLILTGNGAIRAHLARIGAEDLLLPEREARYSFVDLADGARWSVTLDAGRIPWWMLGRDTRIPGTALLDYLSAARLATAGPGTTVAEAIAGRGALWTRFWEPLTLAVLNTTPERGQARLLWRVLSETFLKGAAQATPMLAPTGLGHALVGPAVHRLKAEGAEVRLGRPLRAIEREAGRATALRFADGAETLGPADAVVLALPPSRLRPLMPEIAVPDDACSILNAFFVLPEEAVARAAAQPPILGVLSATTHWIFLRGDVASLTVSASDALGLDAQDPAALLPRLWAETRRALHLSPETEYLAARINKERRATFDQSPDGVAKRPGPHTALANVILAGDATDTGLPATLEGAVRSGLAAARLAAAVGAADREAARLRPEPDRAASPAA